MKYCKKFIFLFSFIIFHFNFFSQTFGNEWINYTQQYFHFPVSNTGLHRLEFNVLDNYLTNYGINIDAIPHDNFQVYGKENEISLLINDQNNNGYLDQQDYIEFYAEKNNGWLDSLVYDSSRYLPDEYYSLFNDTIRYYFSWNSNGNIKEQ